MFSYPHLFSVFSLVFKDAKWGWAGNRDGHDHNDRQKDGSIKNGKMAFGSFPLDPVRSDTICIFLGVRKRGIGENEYTKSFSYLGELMCLPFCAVENKDYATSTSIL